LKQVSILSIIRSLQHATDVFGHGTMAAQAAAVSSRPIGARIQATDGSAAKQAPSLEGGTSLCWTWLPCQFNTQN